MMTRQLRSDELLKVRSSRALDAALAIVSLSGDTRFAELAIQELNRFTTVGWWTVYRLCGESSPVWHLGGTIRSPEVITRAWSCYRNELWKQDRTFRHARPHELGDPAVMAHIHASDVDGPHRAQIYSALGLTERLSFVRAQRGGTALCVNLYRGLGMPDFADDELDDLACVGDLLLRAVEVHVRCATPCEKSSPLDSLPRREREVCDRMLRGWTYDGIAIDLGLSANTVKTYRGRAFEKLGIHHRSELFALMLEQHTGQDSRPQVS